MGAPRRRSAVPLAALVALLLTPGIGAAQSQTTSTIRGTVTGPDGAGLPDVEIHVRHGPTGAERRVLTGPDGAFVVLLLQPGGPYALTATHIGFGDATRSDIRLAIGETRSFALTLLAAAVPVEGVAVDVSRGLVSGRRAGPETLLDEPVLGALPVPSRDVLDLAVVSALVRTTDGGGFSVGGQNDRYNSLLVDGLSAGDAFGLTPSGVPGAQAGARLLPLDAVAQYEILVAPYDARLSGFAGGVLNAVTRTGTNDFALNAFALGRDASLTGDLTLPSGTAKARGIRREMVGISAGGPLVRDRVHYFVAGEVERRHRQPVGYNSGQDDPALVGITPETLDLFKTVFAVGHGVDVGEYGPYELEQSLTNVFGRVDWSLDGGSRLTVRDVFARASNDESPNRTPFEPYGFSSNAAFRTSTNNLVSAQLFTDLGSGGGNELDLSLQRTTDRTRPTSDFPQIEAVLSSAFYAQSANRPIRVGAQFYAQDNDLEQTSARLTNTLTRVRGNSTWTLGASAAWHGVSQRYLPGEKGEYTFITWDDVLDNAPLRYQRTVLLPGQSPGVSFGVAEAGLFAQDQIELDAFTLRFGLRLDAPFVLDHPERNEDVARVFGHSTASVPSGLLLSPRVGVNWEGGDARRTQVRAGAGLFTGQLPYVWLANAFHDNGLRSQVLACFGRYTGFNPPDANIAPPFDPSDAAPTCLAGPPTVARTVTVFDRDFRYPQYAKVSLAIDQEVTPRLAASVDVILSHAVHQIALRELNIQRQDTALGPLRGFGGADRIYYGLPSAQGFSPLRVLPDYGQVLLVTNGSGDRSWSVSAELRGALGDRVDFRAGYAYGRSYDRMSLTSVDLIGAYGSTPTHRDPNDPPLTPSNFDRPHKVVLALYGTPIPGLDDTELSLLYTGESGLPFSYVYRGDLNGDGYPSLGKASDQDNDLVYVPADPLEVPAGPGTTVRLAAALANDPCLKRFSGQMLLRNQCRAPWQNRLDLRAAQRLSVGGASVRIEADLVNVLNLLGRDWGLVRTIPATSSLVQPTERIRGNGDLLVQWIAGLLPLRDAEGTQRIPEPWSVASPASQWQAQLGVRVSFGGGRP